MCIKCPLDNLPHNYIVITGLKDVKEKLRVPGERITGGRARLGVCGGPPEGGMFTLRAKGRVGPSQFVRVGVGLQSTPGGGDPDIKALSQREWPSQGLWLGVRET